MNNWRLIDDYYDGHSVSQLLCCKETISASIYEIQKWKYCPFCCSEIGEQMDCRTHSTPRWVWDRFRDRYDIDCYPRRKDMPAWQVQKRIKLGEKWCMWEKEYVFTDTQTRSSALTSFHDYVELEKQYDKYTVTQYRLTFGSQVYEPEWARS